MHWRHNKKYIIVLFANCFPLIALCIFDGHSLGVLFCALVHLAVRVVLPDIHVVDQARVVLPY